MDISSIINKLSSVSKSKLKIYPQDHRIEINLLNEKIFYTMWQELTKGVLTEDELILCIQAFDNAFVTNLINSEAIEAIKSIFTKVLVSFNGNIDTVYRSQLLAESNLPEPGDNCIYIPEDVIGAAKKYIGLKGSADEKKRAMSGLLGSLGSYFTGINALFVVFDDNKDFEKFKCMSNQMLSLAGAAVIPEEFDISKKIYDGIILRRDYTLENESNDTNSFARILTALLTNVYPARILPTKTVESILPTILLFFNARELASSVSARLQSIKREFETLKNLDKSRILSFKDIAGLNEVIRESERYNTGELQLDAPLEVPFKSTAKENLHITDINMSRTKEKLIKIEKRMKEVQYSRNPNREFEIETYQRPNRRDPLDPDLPGTYQEFGCYPDIHLYIDTSGSITQRDYEGSVMMIIDIAKRMHCDIYINTFSTVISQEAMIRCRNRSKTAILRDIAGIPKVTGGTTINQVWGYINMNEKNRRQLSIIISDFFVDVPRYMIHPENLYYIPIKDPVISQVERFTMNLDHVWRMLF